MLPSLILNVLNIVFVAGCFVRGLIISSPKRVLFRYFTTLSNVLCAIASLIVVIMQLCGGLPFWALLIKYVGTAAVTVTMFTVLLLLGPVSHEWKLLLTRGELFLHVPNQLHAFRVGEKMTAVFILSFAGEDACLCSISALRSCC